MQASREFTIMRGACETCSPLTTYLEACCFCSPERIHRSKPTDNLPSSSGHAKHGGPLQRTFHKSCFLQEFTEANHDFRCLQEFTRKQNGIRMLHVRMATHFVLQYSYKPEWLHLRVKLPAPACSCCLSDSNHHNLFQICNANPSHLLSQSC